MFATPTCAYAVYAQALCAYDAYATLMPPAATAMLYCRADVFFFAARRPLRDVYYFRLLIAFAPLMP